MDPCLRLLRRHISAPPPPRSCPRLTTPWPSRGLAAGACAIARASTMQRGGEADTRRALAWKQGDATTRLTCTDALHLLLHPRRQLLARLRRIPHRAQAGGRPVRRVLLLLLLLGGAGRRWALLQEVAVEYQLGRGRQVSVPPLQTLLASVGARQAGQRGWGR